MKESSKFSNNFSNPQVSTTPTLNPKTSSPSSSILTTPIPSPRILAPTPSILVTPSPAQIPSLKPSVPLKSSPSPSSSAEVTRVPELKGISIDIRYLEGDKEMLSYANKIRKQLVGNYGLNKISVREFKKKFIVDLSCEWSTVRYDPEEEDAARKLKPLVEKIVPGVNWNLLLVNTHLERSITPNNMISLFLENNSALSRLDPANQASRKLSCETYKR